MTNEKNCYPKDCFANKGAECSVLTEKICCAGDRCSFYQSKKERKLRDKKYGSAEVVIRRRIAEEWKIKKKTLRKKDDTPPMKLRIAGVNAAVK